MHNILSGAPQPPCQGVSILPSCLLLRSRRANSLHPFNLSSTSLSKQLCSQSTHHQHHQHHHHNGGTTITTTIVNIPHIKGISLSILSCTQQNSRACKPGSIELKSSKCQKKSGVLIQDFWNPQKEEKLSSHAFPSAAFQRGPNFKTIWSSI